MKHKSTLVLLIAVAIAAVVAYSLSRKPTSEERARQQRKILPGFRTEDIAGIEIEKGADRIVCERRETARDKWRITEPLRLRADRWEVEGILDRFETAEKAAPPIRPGGAEEFAAYGLEEPAGKVTFRASRPSERTWTLLIGKESGAGDLVFVAPPDMSVVHTIRKSVVDKLNVSMNDLRSKRLAEEFDLSDLSGVELKAAEWAGEEPFEVTCKKEEGTWELRHPVHDLADPNAVERLARRLNDHTVSRTDFVVDDPTVAGEYGLDKPDLSITFLLGESRRSIALSRKMEGDEEVYYAMNKAEPAIVRVTRVLFDDLRKGPEELRERELVRFEKEDAEKIVVTRGQTSLVLEKAEGEWQVAGEEAAPADGPTISSLLEGLNRARVRDFVADEPESLAPYGLGEDESWSVALSGSEDRLLAEAELGSEDEEAGIVYARRTGYPAVLSIGKEPYIRDLKRGRLALLDRLVLEEPQSRAIRVSLTHTGGECRCEREDAESDWKLTGPVQGRADGAAVRELLNRLTYLKAEGFATESAKALAPYGLDEPRIAAEVTYREPGGEDETGAEDRTWSRRLLVGAESQEGPQGFFAKLAEGERVFLLAQDVVDDMAVGLASRLICEAEGIEEIEFNRDGRSLSFVYDRQERLWKEAGGEEVSAELRMKLEDAAELLEDFTGSRVTAYVESDPAAYGFDRPALTIRLKDRTVGGKTVVLGKETDGGRFVTGPATSFVLVAAEKDAATLLAVAEGPQKETPPEKPEQ